jgi:hypothetical protein
LESEQDFEAYVMFPEHIFSVSDALALLCSRFQAEARRREAMEDEDEAMDEDWAGEREQEKKEAERLKTGAGATRAEGVDIREAAANRREREAALRAAVQTRQAFGKVRVHKPGCRCPWCVRAATAKDETTAGECGPTGAPPTGAPPTAAGRGGGAAACPPAEPPEGNEVDRVSTPRRAAASEPVLNSPNFVRAPAPKRRRR